MNKVRATLKKEMHSTIVLSIFIVLVAASVFLVYYFNINEYFTSQ